METVAGIRELKSKLSQYLAEVKKGRTVAITERGRVIASIVPAQEQHEVQALKRLAKSGLGSWTAGKPKGASHPVVIKGKPVGQIIIEERR